MCEQTPIHYKHGDVVWVKLDLCWWPGQVIDFDALPSDLQESFAPPGRKKPLVVVEFFQEANYEYVMNLNAIYSYNCTKKDDFIRRAMDLIRAKNSLMDKFPTDIQMAEEMTGGNADILKDPKYGPQKKKISYASMIFGSGKKGSSGKPKGRPRISDRQIIKRNVIHPRFTGICDDYEVRLLVQTSIPASPARQNKYSCDQCDFQSSRIDVVVLHNKSHAYDAGPRATSRSFTKPRRPPKKFRFPASRTSTIDEDLALLEQGISLTDNESSTEEEEEEEEENEIVEIVKPKVKRKQRPGEKRKGKKKAKVAQPAEEGKKKDIRVDLLAEWEDDDEEEEDETVSINNNQSVESATTSFAETTIDKSAKTEEEDKSCFDFKEEEDNHILTATTSSGRKIPRVIPEKRKSIEPDTSGNVEDSFEEDLNRFAEVLESTAAPELPSGLKCEQNFHYTKAIKFPDKGAESPPQAESTPKLINIKKRFVKTFEDFELSLRIEKDKEDEEERRLKEENDKPKTGDVGEKDAAVEMEIDFQFDSMDSLRLDNENHSASSEATDNLLSLEIADNLVVADKSLSGEVIDSLEQETAVTKAKTYVETIDLTEAGSLIANDAESDKKQLTNTETVIKIDTETIGATETDTEPMVTTKTNTVPVVDTETESVVATEAITVTAKTNAEVIASKTEPSIPAEIDAETMITTKSLDVTDTETMIAPETETIIPETKTIIIPETETITPETETIIIPETETMTIPETDTTVTPKTNEATTKPEDPTTITEIDLTEDTKPEATTPTETPREAKRPSKDSKTRRSLRDDETKSRRRHTEEHQPVKKSKYSRKSHHEESKKTRTKQPEDPEPKERTKRPSFSLDEDDGMKKLMSKLPSFSADHSSTSYSVDFEENLKTTRWDQRPSEATKKVRSSQSSFLANYDEYIKKSKSLEVNEDTKKRPDHEDQKRSRSSRDEDLKKTKSHDVEDLKKTAPARPSFASVFEEDLKKRKSARSSLPRDNEEGARKTSTSKSSSAEVTTKPRRSWLSHGVDVKAASTRPSFASVFEEEMKKPRSTRSSFSRETNEGVKKRTSPSADIKELKKTRPTRDVEEDLKKKTPKPSTDVHEDTKKSRSPDFEEGVKKTRSTRSLLAHSDFDEDSKKRSSKVDIETGSSSGDTGEELKKIRSTTKSQYSPDFEEGVKKTRSTRSDFDEDSKKKSSKVDIETGPVQQPSSSGDTGEELMKTRMDENVTKPNLAHTIYEELKKISSHEDLKKTLSPSLSGDIKEDLNRSPSEFSHDDLKKAAIKSTQSAEDPKKTKSTRSRDVEDLKKVYSKQPSCSSAGVDEDLKKTRGTRSSISHVVEDLKTKSAKPSEASIDVDEDLKIYLKQPSLAGVDEDLKKTRATRSSISHVVEDLKTKSAKPSAASIDVDEDLKIYLKQPSLAGVDEDLKKTRATRSSISHVVEDLKTKSAKPSAASIDVDEDLKIYLKQPSLAGVDEDLKKTRATRSSISHVVEDLKTKSAKPSAASIDVDEDLKIYLKQPLAGVEDLKKTRATRSSISHGVEDLKTKSAKPSAASIDVDEDLAGVDENLKKTRATRSSISDVVEDLKTKSAKSSAESIDVDEDLKIYLKQPSSSLAGFDEDLKKTRAARSSISHVVEDLKTKSAKSSVASIDIDEDLKIYLKQPSSSLAGFDEDLKKTRATRSSISHGVEYLKTKSAKPFASSVDVDEDLKVYSKHPPLAGVDEDLKKTRATRSSIEDSKTKSAKSSTASFDLDEDLKTKSGKSSAASIDIGEDLKTKSTKSSIDVDDDLKTKSSTASIDVEDLKTKSTKSRTALINDEDLKRKSSTAAIDIDEDLKRKSSTASIDVEDLKKTRATRSSISHVAEDLKTKSAKPSAASIDVDEDLKIYLKQPSLAGVDEDLKMTKSTKSPTVSIDAGEDLKIKSLTASIDVEDLKTTKSTKSSTVSIDVDEDLMRKSSTASIDVDEDLKIKSSTASIDVEDLKMKSTKSTVSIDFDEDLKPKSTKSSIGVQEDLKIKSGKPSAASFDYDDNVKKSRSTKSSFASEVQKKTKSAQPSIPQDLDDDLKKMTSASSIDVEEDVKISTLKKPSSSVDVEKDLKKTRSTRTLEIVEDLKKTTDATTGTKKGKTKLPTEIDEDANKTKSKTFSPSADLGDTKKVPTFTYTSADIILEDPNKVKKTKSKWALDLAEETKTKSDEVVRKKKSLWTPDDSSSDSAALIEDTKKPKSKWSSISADTEQDAKKKLTLDDGVKETSDTVEEVKKIKSKWSALSIDEESLKRIKSAPEDEIKIPVQDSKKIKSKWSAVSADEEVTKKKSKLIEAKEESTPIEDDKKETQFTIPSVDDSKKTKSKWSPVPRVYETGGAKKKSKWADEDRVKLSKWASEKDEDSKKAKKSTAVSEDYEGGAKKKSKWASLSSTGEETADKTSTSTEGKEQVKFSDSKKWASLSSTDEETAKKTSTSIDGKEEVKSSDSKQGTSVESKVLVDENLVAEDSKKASLPGDAAKKQEWSDDQKDSERTKSEEFKITKSTTIYEDIQAVISSMSTGDVKETTPKKKSKWSSFSAEEDWSKKISKFSDELEIHAIIPSAAKETTSGWSLVPGDYEDGTKKKSKSSDKETVIRPASPVKDAKESKTQWSSLTEDCEGEKKKFIEDVDKEDIQTTITSGVKDAESGSLEEKQKFELFEDSSKEELTLTVTDNDERDVKVKIPSTSPAVAAKDVKERKSKWSSIAEDGTKNEEEGDGSKLKLSAAQEIQDVIPSVVTKDAKESKSKRSGHYEESAKKKSKRSSVTEGDSLKLSGADDDEKKESGYYEEGTKKKPKRSSIFMEGDSSKSTGVDDDGGEKEFGRYEEGTKKKWKRSSVFTEDDSSKLTGADVDEKEESGCYEEGTKKKKKRSSVFTEDDSSKLTSADDDEKKEFGYYEGGTKKKPKRSSVFTEDDSSKLAGANDDDKKVLGYYDEGAKKKSKISSIFMEDDSSNDDKKEVQADTKKWTSDCEVGTKKKEDKDSSKPTPDNEITLEPSVAITDTESKLFSALEDYQDCMKIKSKWSSISAGDDEKGVEDTKKTKLKDESGSKKMLKRTIEDVDDVTIVDEVPPVAEDTKKIDWATRWSSGPEVFEKQKSKWTYGRGNLKKKSRWSSAEETTNKLPSVEESKWSVIPTEESKNKSKSDATEESNWSSVPTLEPKKTSSWSLVDATEETTNKSKWTSVSSDGADDSKFKSTFTSSTSASSKLSATEDTKIRFKWSIAPALQGGTKKTARWSTDDDTKKAMPKFPSRSSDLEELTKKTKPNYEDTKRKSKWSVEQDVDKSSTERSGLCLKVSKLKSRLMDKLHESEIELQKPKPKTWIQQKTEERSLKRRMSSKSPRRLSLQSQEISIGKDKVEVSVNEEVNAEDDVGGSVEVKIPIEESKLESILRSPGLPQEHDENSALNTLATISELSSYDLCKADINIEKNLTVVSESDLGDAQVEIAKVPIIEEGTVKATTVASFSVDFTEDLSVLENKKKPSPEECKEDAKKKKFRILEDVALTEENKKSTLEEVFECKEDAKKKKFRILEDVAIFEKRDEDKAKPPSVEEVKVLKNENEDVAVLGENIIVVSDEGVAVLEESKVLEEQEIAVVMLEEVVTSPIPADGSRDAALLDLKTESLEGVDLFENKKDKKIDILCDVKLPEVRPKKAVLPLKKLFPTKKYIEQVPNSVEMEMAKLTDTSMDTTIVEQPQESTTSTKLLEILTDPKVPKPQLKIANPKFELETVHAPAKPKTKLLIRSSLPGSSRTGGKETIISEKIIKTTKEIAHSSPVSVQKTNDTEGIEAFIIQKKDASGEGLKAAAKKPPMVMMKKPTILEHTIVKPKDEVAQQRSDENVFDIDSMPIVLTDQILTPEMPIVIPQEKPAAKMLHGKMRLLNRAPILKEGGGGRAPPFGKGLKPQQKIFQHHSIARQGVVNQGKGGKVVIVPSEASTSTVSKYTVGKRLVKKIPSTATIVSGAQKLHNVQEPTGNKIMIVTNNQGQQSRVVLTPAQQKLIGYQSPTLKKVVKGGKSANIISQTIINSKGQITTTNQAGITSTTSSLSQVKRTKIEPSRNKVLGQKLLLQSSLNQLKPGQPRTIIIKNPQGQTVKKIHGTDDALLEKQVQEQIEAINRATWSHGAVKTVPKKFAKKTLSEGTKIALQHKAQMINSSSGSKAVPPLSPIIKKTETQVKPKPPPSPEPEKSGEKRAPHQLVIQDALGNQTTITEGQILALPSETVDGQPQSYMLVTLDETGNLTPLNNEALMSLDPNLNLGGDLSNMVLQIDQGAVNAEPSPVTTPPPPPPEPKVEEVVEAEVVPEKPAEEPPQPDPNAMQAVACAINNGESNQQLIITGDPASTQKFLESLSEGNADLANLLANTEGNILIHADGQQILINTDADNPLLLSMNSDGAGGPSMESGEGSGNPIFSSPAPKNQDILAAALADTDVFQQEQSIISAKVTQSQLSPVGASLYPINVNNVLETSAMSSPIMTPLEVPSTNTKKIDVETDILAQVPKNVDLPITITDPNISQTVAHQQAALMSSDLHTNLDLPLAIQDVVVTSAEMNSPTFTYALPHLDDSVDMQKPFTNSISMPLLTEISDEVANASTTLPSEIIEVERDKDAEPAAIPEDVKKTDSQYLLATSGLSSITTQMCSSLSEPPPDMFDFTIDQAYDLKQEISPPVTESPVDDEFLDAEKTEESESEHASSFTPQSNSPSTNSTDSCEIPVQPEIVTDISSKSSETELRPFDDEEKM